MEIVKQKNQEILCNQAQRIQEFLKEKEVISKDASEMVITFEDGRKILLSELMLEFTTRAENYPLRDLLAKVQQFHKTFGIETLSDPQFPTITQQRIRFNLLKEEMEETLAAAMENDLIEGLDGLCDQLYILLGTMDHYGMQDIIVPSFLTVHDSNMTKLDADGNPIYRKEDGKVIKGPFFKKPNEELSKILVKVAKDYNDKQRLGKNVEG